MDHEEYKRKALEPIINYIESVMASYSKEELEARIKEALPKKESEDERIRNDIMVAVENSRLPYERIEEIRFYLNNQKEQKPAEWSDTDMKEARNNLISVCRDWECGKQTTLLPIVAIRARYFLEHLTEPKPAEWIEKDEH